MFAPMIFPATHFRSALLAILFVAVGGCHLPADLAQPEVASTGEETENAGEGTNPETPVVEPAQPAKPGFESAGWDVFKKQIASGSGGPKLKDRYSQVKTNEKVIAITFDDGPHKDNTPRLLDMLKKRNIKATFYVVGDMIKYNPQILARTVQEGHEIGNHTVTHGTLSRMSTSSLHRELANAHQMIVEVTGIAPRTMRPPGGAIKSSQREYMLKEFGYPTILWSVDPEDWKKPGVSVVTRRLVNGASSGGILLVHDLHKSTVDAMPAALDQLLAKGFRFVTVSELLAMDQTDSE